MISQPLQPPWREAARLPPRPGISALNVVVLGHTNPRAKGTQFLQVTQDLTSFSWATPADALCACSPPFYTNRVWGGFEPGIFLRVLCDS